MNKFVKGAKNLAFALSFITVAACSDVNKADFGEVNEKIEGLKKLVVELKKEIFESEKGGDEGGKKVMVYSKDEIGGLIDDLKNGKVDLDALKNSFLNDPVCFGRVCGPDFVFDGKCFSNFEIVLNSLSSYGGVKYMVKNGERVFYHNGKDGAIFNFDDLNVLGICLSNGGVLNWNMNWVFRTDTIIGVSFGGLQFDLSDGDVLTCVTVLLELGLKVGKSFDDLGFSSWKITDGKIGGVNFRKKDKDIVEKFVCVLNKYKKGCCLFDGEKVSFIGNMGWTKDGSIKNTSNVVVVLI